MAKSILISDTEYELTRAYKQGAKANRDGISYRSNPYRDGSQAHDDWNNGHVNEDENEDQYMKELEQAAKIAMTPGSWNPVRKGAIYCAPACGRGCTHVEWQDATHKGKVLVDRLGKGWTAVISENLGWHFRAVKNDNQDWAVHESGPRRFWASLMFAGHQFHADGTTPKGAVTNTLQKAKDFAFLLTDEIEEFEK